jgi:mannan endo-1,4-beta-mannosidase
MRIRQRLAGLMAAAMVAAFLGAGGEPAAARADSGSRVSVVNGSFTLDGRPWWPVGLDAYELGTNWVVNEGCGAQVDLDR